MMELDILKLIYDYSVNGKLVDSKFIDKIIEIIVTKKSLDNYVRNVIFTNKLDKNDYVVACAAYNPHRAEVLVDYESIKIAIENGRQYDCLFCDVEQIMFKNLMIMQFILHELEHAYQFKQADNKSDKSVEAKLIRASFILERAMENPNFIEELYNNHFSMKDFEKYFLQNRELYKQYYRLNPTERLAQVNSFRTVVNSIEPIKKYIPNLYEFKNASLFEEMLKGYQESWNEGTCPTEVYLSGIRQSKIWSEFDFYSQDSEQLMKSVSEKYSLTKRMSLGLPISYGEYETTDNWLHTTNKFNI